jgi:ABC-type dipeptide/oligopeptide/nickel transport system permease subunit
MAETAELDFRPVKSSSLWMDVWRQMRRNRFAIVGMVILAILIFVAVAAPLIAPYDPYDEDFAKGIQPPSREHLLGTDELGRDLLSRLIYGARISLRVGLIVVGIAGGIGVTLGAISGFYGGLADQVIMRVVDIIYAFPFLVLAIAVASIVGPSLTNTMIVLGCISWIGYARLVRGQVLSLREEDYVNAARVVGASNWRIIWRHILPNCLGVVIVTATFGVAGAILSASALSYIGMGAQPPTAEWGAMLSNAKKNMRHYPVMAIAPGMAIMITVLAINFVGDALRDALDPRLRG